MLRDEYLRKHGSVEYAAVHLAEDLMQGDWAIAGDTLPNAILAVQEFFPEVDAEVIEETCTARGLNRVKGLVWLYRQLGDFDKDIFDRVLAGELEPSGMELMGLPDEEPDEDRR
jgi:hypothetical protein